MNCRNSLSLGPAYGGPAYGGWGCDSDVIIWRRSRSGADAACRTEHGSSDADGACKPDEANAPTVSDEAGTDETKGSETQNGLAEKWDRLIYVPFKELQKVFDNQDASVVLPYAEYLDLLKRAINNGAQTTANQDAVMMSTNWSAVVEKDLARITAEFKINVLKEEGWATLPVNFGATAIGKVEPNDGSVLLKGAGQGTYELLIKGAGQKTVKLELLATVLTSPEDKSFAIQCPPTGISELVVTIPEADQTVKITPLQVLLPVDGAVEQGKTVAKASLGATHQFQVHWNPRVGSKPVMDLLSSVSNDTNVRIEQGLLQVRTVLNYEILRGELRDVTILVPKDARIIDVVSAAGRIRSWNAEAVGDTHQVIKADYWFRRPSDFRSKSRPSDRSKATRFSSSANRQTENSREFMRMPSFAKRASWRSSPIRHSQRSSRLKAA